MKKSPSPEFLIILAILSIIPIRYGLIPLLDSVFYPPKVDHRTTAEKVKIYLGMDLTNLVESLTLKPVVNGEEPFIITYLMPLKVDATSDSFSYIPEDYAAQLRLLQLLDNGHAVENCKIYRQTNSTYLVQWNAIHGTHALQAELSFDVHKPFGSVHIQGPERMENIRWQIEDSTNVVRWSEDSGLKPNQARLHGYLQITNADYKVLFYDTNSIFLKAASGRTAKGVIDETWDLKDKGGQIVSDFELDAEVYVWSHTEDINNPDNTNAAIIFGPYHYHFSR